MTFHLLWLAWLLAFLPIELPPALRHKYAGTLTAHTRWAFCFPPAPLPRPLWRTRRVVFIAFYLALGLHMVANLHAWPWLILSAVPFGITFIVATFFEKGEA